MANTFKVVTKANVTSADVIYTVAGSTTTVSLGSDTSGRAGNNDEANQTVELVTSVSIPGNSSLELMSGNKIVMETTDTLSVTAGASTDVVLSIMEIT